MAVNLIHLRSALNSRFPLLLQTKLLSNKTYFSDDSTKKNLYEILEVPSNSTHNEIKHAYYNLTLKYHPDRNDSCEMSAIKFREVAEAYEVLGNYSLRKKYDRGVPLLSLKKTAPVPVDHKVEFQEFFDSRSMQTAYRDRADDFDEYAKFTKKKTDDFYEPPEDFFKPPKAIQGLIAGTFVAMAFYKVYIREYLF